MLNNKPEQSNSNCTTSYFFQTDRSDFSGIHIIAAENILYVQAMDLNMAISCTVESNTEANGEIVVSAKHFSELMRKLPGETVTIVKNKEEKTIP